MSECGMHGCGILEVCQSWGTPGSDSRPEEGHLLPALSSTCSQGRWACQQGAHCPSTCVLYGEGHMVTFDGQRFMFDGNCEYTLATVLAWGVGEGCREWGRDGASAQRCFSAGRLWHQQLPAHLQGPDRKHHLWEVGGHLFPCHQDYPGRKQLRQGEGEHYPAKAPTSTFLC